MKIQQCRKGFAFNSSSAHSVVFLKDGDYDIGADCSEYLWNDFLLVSKEEKARYFAAQFHKAIAASIGDAGATLVTHGYFGHSGTEDIDHQSIMHFPRLHDGSLALDLVKDVFQSYIGNPKVGVAGGNDNSDMEMHEGRPDVPMMDDYGGMIARKESDGTWVVFSRQSGNKIRYTPDFLASVKNRKADTPELVDIKITDYCAFGCSFCYQGSTPKGKHSSLKDFKKLIDKLVELKVFEVAIGGGEPTEHPDFAKMLKYTRSKGIIPNFTTRSTKWLDTPLEDTVRDNVGAFAVSCDNFKDFKEKFDRLQSRKAGDIYREVSSIVSFQFIAGVTAIEELEKVIAHRGSNYYKLSLVGYKTTGRATKAVKLDGEKLYKLLQERFNNVSVDVSFLQQYPNFVQKLTCDTAEGGHSMYVDLVAKTMSRSSYCEEKDPLSLTNLKDYFKSL